MADLTLLQFAQQLLAKGKELGLRSKGGNRLAVWPDPKGLSESEFIFIAEHRQELKDFVRADLHPKLPDDFDPKAPLKPTTPPCPYCGPRCVGESHWAYRTLHATDPREVERRSADATAVMQRQIGKVSPWL